MNNDLISRLELKEAIETYDKFACLPNGKLEPFRNLEHSEMFEPYVHLRDILNAIDNAPTVEEKRPNGKWIDKGIYDVCPFCKSGYMKSIVDKCVDLTNNRMNFCFKCGADMRSSVKKGDNSGEIK